MFLLVRRNIILAVVVLAINGCTSTPSNPRDPLEPMNRAIYKFNDKADHYVLKPVAQGYHDYIPQIMRTGVRNFFSNLNDATSAVNYSLQADPKPALYNLSRFALNTTVGIFGLFDLASTTGRRYPQSSFGDTFAKWGWKDSSYLVIPLMGPSTLRDGTGVASSLAFQNNVLYQHPNDTVSFGFTALSGINTREKLLGVEDLVSGASLDPYAYVRDAWLQMRAKQAGDTLPKQNDDDINIDDLMN